MMTERDLPFVLEVELVDILGIVFWIAVLSGAVLHTVNARVPKKWLIERFLDAFLLMVCLISLAGIIGFITSGEIAATGSLIAMILWCVAGFQIWATSRWKREQVKHENASEETTSKDGLGSEFD